MLRYTIVIAILTFAMTASAEDRTPEPKPCSFDKPIHIWELVRAMREGCYLATGTVIHVPVVEVHPGDPVPPTHLSISEVDQLDATVKWLAVHPKIARVRVEVYLPAFEMTRREAEAQSTARAQEVAAYLIAKGVDPERISYAGKGVSENGVARIDFVILEVRKD